MRIGCPREIKQRENRVGLIPACAKMLLDDGHTVLLESGAGLGAGISDDDYSSLGVKILSTAEEVWESSDLIVKVKEPLPPEFARMRPGQTLFTYLHLAAEPELTEALLKSKVTGVAYETIAENNYLPLLKPMSEVAGRMSVQVGAWCLESHQGGRGILLGGVTGVERARVTIIGGGVVGSQAAQVAIGMGANVTIVDTNLSRLTYLDEIWPGKIQTLYSAPHHIYESVVNADLVIGAVLLAGAKAPNLVKKEYLKDMKQGAVIVDVAVDQGGCVETTRRTTHDDPTYVVDGVIHYGVANMPGAVPRTSTFALANATTPYLRQIANLGIEQAAQNNLAIKKGVNTQDGKLTCKPVADALGLDYTPI